MRKTIAISVDFIAIFCRKPLYRKLTRKRFCFIILSQMERISIPFELRKMNSIFEAAGFEAYLVGGALRDTIMGKEAHDWDVATSAKPEDVMRIFRRVIPTGIKHGTVTVLFMKRQIEVTTFRTESEYSDGRHPDKVQFASSVEEDLSRRDFTMNAMAASLRDGRIVDPFCGREDIIARTIRTVGNAHERFMEDGLRPIRAIRFASQLEFSIEKSTFSDIFNAETLEKVAGISAERFRDEFCKILLSRRPSAGLALLEQTGILRIFVPELLEGRGCVQRDSRGFHEFNVLDHNFRACDGAPCDKLNVRLAALFHDIAKPRTKTVSEDCGEIHFYNHECAGEKISQDVMRRLKFSNDTIQKVSHLVREHMFFYESSWSDAAVRRFVRRVGAENIDDLFDLRLADVCGMQGENQKESSAESRLSNEGKSLSELKGRIEKVLSQNSALSLKDLAIDGNDLIAIGMNPGKEIGAALKELLEFVTDSPEMNTRERLLEEAKRFRAK